MEPIAEVQPDEYDDPSPGKLREWKLKALNEWKPAIGKGVLYYGIDSHRALLMTVPDADMKVDLVIVTDDFSDDECYNQDELHDDWYGDNPVIQMRKRVPWCEDHRNDDGLSTSVICWDATVTDW